MSGTGKENAQGWERDMRVVHYVLIADCNLNAAASILVPSENNLSYSYAWVVGESRAEGTQA